MSKLQGDVLTLPKMSGSVSVPKHLSGNVGAKTINIGGNGEGGGGTCEGAVLSVNGIIPDENGNVEIDTATSWNDLTDKPFGSTFEFVELASVTGVVDQYDADTLMASFQTTLDFVPIHGKSYKLVATDGVQTIEAVQHCQIIDFPAMGVYIANIGPIDDTAPIALIQGVKGGAWAVNFLANTEVGAEWTVTVYEHSEIVNPLDGKYLPDGIPFVESASVGQAITVKAVNNGKPTEFEAVNLVKSYKDLPDAPVGEKITTILGERTVNLSMLNSASLGSFSLVGCNLVRFDGVEYEVSPFANLTENLYGNPALRASMFPSNGMPFVLANNTMTNSVTIYVSELGTHTISAYKRELVFLSEKYLPDSVVLESELIAKGYQTEAQVTELINNALGVIENGTY